jgi:hypothetical protein
LLIFYQPSYLLITLQELKDSIPIIREVYRKLRKPGNSTGGLLAMLVAYPREPSPKLGSQGVPAQLFAYHLTREKGYDPDHPWSIQKVTETR